MYQAQIVPQQNAEVEFEHFEQAQNDLVDLRAGILQAGSTDQPQYQTVQLGTTYPTRVFAINPPSPAGTIRTTDSFPITIAYASNDTVIKTIPTRFIQYRPGYNELDQSPTWYDASVLYFDARGEGGGIAVTEDQALVDGREVQITALQNEFRQSGTGRVTLELRPAESVTREFPEGDLTVTVPTRLSGEEYWDGTDIPSHVYSVTDDANEDGVYNLTIETTATNLTVDTVGVQEAPEDPAQNDDARIGGSDGDGNKGNTQAGQVSAVDGSTPDSESKELIFDVRNAGTTAVTITDFSISTPGNQNSGVDQVTNIDKPPGQDEVQIGGGSANPDNPSNDNNYQTDGRNYGLNQTVSLSNGGTVSVTMGEFKDGNIQLTYELVDNKANADITVGFTFEGSSTTEFYFRVTNVNT